MRIVQGYKRAKSGKPIKLPCNGCGDKKPVPAPTAQPTISTR